MRLFSRGADEAAAATGEDGLEEERGALLGGGNGAESAGGEDDLERPAALPRGSSPAGLVFSRGRSLDFPQSDDEEESWYARRTSKAVLVATGAIGCLAAIYNSPIITSGRSWGNAFGVEMLLESSPKALHWGEPCLKACGGSPGVCHSFCGSGNACCLYGSMQDPPECAGIVAWGTIDNYTCVVPTNLAYKVEEIPTPGVLHWAEDCWVPCANKSGYCSSYCGFGNVCCRWGAAFDAPECAGITRFGAKDSHTCVAVADPEFEIEKEAPNGSTVAHWGEECLTSCGVPGYCREFCGLGNACCHFRNASDPPECGLIRTWGAKDSHTCVAPASPAFVTAAAPPGVEVAHWGEECWNACGAMGGACPQYCGVGNACCRFGSTKDPPECHGILLWGSKEQHTCVKPAAPYLYVNHFAEDCWKPCNGAGYCEDWCGDGNACCRFGSKEDPHECRGVTYFPTHQSHTCVKAAGRYAQVPNDPAEGACIPGEVKNAQGVCVPSDTPALMTFYLYYAASDEYPTLQNTNLANLDGALMYLHRNVVTACPRKGGVQRIVRYVVSVQNTDELFKATRKQFAPYTKFHDGKCVNTTSNPCIDEYVQYGFVVGCQKASSSSPEYGAYENPVFYSLPGGGDGTAGACIAPNGEKGCTWKAEYAGEVRLDELSGIASPATFCSPGLGHVEYNETLDKGFGSSFWDNRRDASACKHRASYLRELFKMRYPDYPATLGAPICSH